MNEYERLKDKYNFQRKAIIATSLGGMIGGNAMVIVGNIISNSSLEATGTIGIIAGASSLVLGAQLIQKPIAPQYPESI